MQNVTATREGDELVLRIRLDQPVGRSSSGKTMILATTGGNQDVPGLAGAKYGVNVFTK